MLTTAPLWFFIISFLGAVITWFAADHFREQILGDSHRLVREVALRYLQVMVGLFAIFVLGIVLSVGGMFNRVFNSGDSEDNTTALAATDLSETSAPEILEIAASPTAEILPTLAVDLFPPTDTPTETDSGLSDIETAVVVNTNGIGVNAREIPGLGGAVLEVVPEDTRLTLLGEVQSADGYTWYLVVLPNGQQGWIADLFLAFSGQ